LAVQHPVKNKRPNLCLQTVKRLILKGQIAFSTIYAIEFVAGFGNTMEGWNVLALSKSIAAYERMMT
jgi:hypothetical protein